MLCNKVQMKYRGYAINFRWSIRVIRWSAGEVSGFCYKVLTKWIKDSRWFFKIQEGLLSENVKSLLHNKITYIQHHFSTIGKDTGWCIYPHFLCIHTIIIGNRVHRKTRKQKWYPTVSHSWQIIKLWYNHNKKESVIHVIHSMILLLCI